MTEEGFQLRWKAAVRFRHVSPLLSSLVRAVYRAVLTQTASEREVVAALDDLLLFLASASGRTDANCCATDSFFSASWEGDWLHLSPALRGILGDMGGALHDSIYAPKIAANFSSLPEQLLERVRGIGS